MLHIPEGGLKLEREFTLSVSLGEDFDAMAHEVIDTMEPCNTYVFRPGVEMQHWLHGMQEVLIVLKEPEPMVETVVAKDWLPLVCQWIRWGDCGGMTPAWHHHNMKECLIPPMSLSESEEAQGSRAFQNLYGEIRLHSPYRNFLRLGSKSDIVKFLIAQALVDAVGTLTVAVPAFLNWKRYLDFLRDKEGAAEEVRHLLADPHCMFRTDSKHKSYWDIGYFWPRDLSERWTSAMEQFDKDWLNAF